MRSGAKAPGITDGKGRYNSDGNTNGSRLDVINNDDKEKNKNYKYESDSISKIINMKHRSSNLNDESFVPVNKKY